MATIQSQGRTRNADLIGVDHDNINMNRGDGRVGHLELRVAHIGDGIVCKEAYIGMMIACDAGHGYRRAGRLLTPTPVGKPLYSKPN